MCSCSSHPATATTRIQENDGNFSYLTTDEERDSSSTGGDDSSMCDNDFDFNDAESSDK